MKPIQVVAAVRKSVEGKLWTCRRTDDGAHSGLVGMWEYPGGKVEDGETLEEGLTREMIEEFGVEIQIHSWIDSVTTQYGDKTYEVHFFHVEFLSEPELRVHDKAFWCDIGSLQWASHLPSGTIFNRRLASYKNFLS
jgi:8-oxo-dGTP diphosphatase